jgi:outer membrane protein assembly factor BamA
MASYFPLMNVPRILAVWILASLLAGADTRVRITGLQRKSEAQVLDLMGDRLEHVRNSPAIPPLADDAAFMLSRLLRKDGYADVQVGWRIANAREITLIVREGRRMSLGKVTIEGMDRENARRLSRIYAAPAERDRPFGLGAPPFREEDVAIGLANILRELNSRGYWSAAAEITSREADDGGQVNLTIGVNPGVRHRIGQPVVTSVDGRGVKLTSGAVSRFAGRYATTAHLNAMRSAAEELAVSRGYPNARIRMERRLAGGEFIPEFRVDLGGRVRLNKISVTGHKITNEDRILSRVRGMVGDWYESTMNRRLHQFLSTGAFRSARVETRPAGHRLVDVTLHLEESRAREVSLAAGFGSYQGFIARATYANRNLAGMLWGLSSGIELSNRGVLGDVRVTDPWVGGSDVSATARAYAMFYDREGYNTYESGVEGWLNREFGDHYSVELLLGTSFANLTTDGLPGAALGETVYAHPRVRLVQKLDHRDNPVLPKRGWHLESPLQIGAAVGDDSTAYVMTGISGGWFHELSRHYDIGIGGDFRVILPSGDGSDLPIDMRLFNGGSRSVRSFPERELGPSVNGYATGGEFMWNTNVELIRNFGGALKAVAFFDAGALTRNYEDAGSAEVELATGLGLRFDLPIGPVRLEYGYNLTRDRGEPAGTLHFAIGSAF